MASNIQWAASKELSLDGNKKPETITNDKGETTWTRTTQELRTAFQNYCNPRKNITFERHTRNQEQGETIDQNATELRKLASTCEFKDLRDGLIRDRMICGINNQTLRERLLRESDLTLEKALDICRASEHSKQQMKTISRTHNANIDALKRRTARNFANVTESPQAQANDQRTPCGNCDTYHKPRSCPAYGKQCASCSRLGHFAKFCRSTQRQQSRRSFYCTVSELFADNPGCETDIGGKSLDEHDRNLKLTLDRVKEIHMTLNKDKLKVRETELVYLGEKLTADGLKPDESQIQAIVKTLAYRTKLD
ncbi:uncharacterized protein [Montipora capricornis]|uniref:uncharacterized protein n=1 Tax=Montipora capricornis TaxID=246305 RepID=UPI0035F1525C